MRRTTNPYSCFVAPCGLAECTAVALFAQNQIKEIYVDQIWPRMYEYLPFSGADHSFRLLSDHKTYGSNSGRKSATGGDVVQLFF